MKKILYVLIGALLVFAIPFTAFADDDANANGNSTFDHTVFSLLDYYSEDKFDKTWSVLGAPSKDSMNGTFAISVTGTSDNAITNVTIVFTENTAANLLRYNINYAKILFDDGRVINFVFPPVLKQYFIDNSTIPMYFFTKENAVTFLEAISQTCTISLRIGYDSGNTDEEFSEEEFADLKTIANVLLQHNALEKYDDQDAQTFEELGFQFSISE